MCAKIAQNMDMCHCAVTQQQVAMQHDGIQQQMHHEKKPEIFYTLMDRCNPIYNGWKKENLNCFHFIDHSKYSAGFWKQHFWWAVMFQLQNDGIFQNAISSLMHFINTASESKWMSYVCFQAHKPKAIL